MSQGSDDGLALARAKYEGVLAACENSVTNNYCGDDGHAKAETKTEVESSFSDNKVIITERFIIQR